MKRKDLNEFILMAKQTMLETAFEFMSESKFEYYGEVLAMINIHVDDSPKLKAMQCIDYIVSDYLKEPFTFSMKNERIYKVIEDVAYDNNMLWNDARAKVIKDTLQEIINKGAKLL